MCILTVKITCSTLILMPYKDKEKDRERQREYYQQNKEKVQKRVAKYRAANPEKAKAIEKQFRMSETRRSWYAEYRTKNKEKLKAYRRSYHLKIKYGITSKQYDQMLIDQNACCALCGVSLSNEKKICIDHCHQTNKVRGLIHHNCNILLGHANESIIHLQQAINYLRKHKS